MIGVVSRIDADGVYVDKLAAFPGQELGPLPAVTHRSGTVVPLPDAYAEGDRVRVVEDSPNDFIVLGLLEGGAS